jgi:hypothetical protein
MTENVWTYPAELLAALVGFGLAPTSATPPRVVRDQLNDLYRFEIRRLKRRLLAGEFPNTQYVERVVGLRKQYWPLSLTLAQWQEICRSQMGD